MSDLDKPIAVTVTKRQITGAAIGCGVFLLVAVVLGIVVAVLNQLSNGWIH